MSFRVTHIDMQHRRRQIDMVCSSSAVALEIAVQLYGAAWRMAAICRRGPRSKT